MGNEEILHLALFLCVLRVLDFERCMFRMMNDFLR